MTKVKCPNCSTEVSLKDNPFRPFCSLRCKTTDLGSWADEKYSIAGDEAGEEELKKISKEENTYH